MRGRWRGLPSLWGCKGRNQEGVEEPPDPQEALTRRPGSGSAGREQSLLDSLRELKPALEPWSCAPSSLLPPGRRACGSWVVKMREGFALWWALLPAPPEAAVRVPWVCSQRPVVIPGWVLHCGPRGSRGGGPVPGLG